jgi:predicted nucleotidyltransferase
MRTRVHKKRTSRQDLRLPSPRPLDALASKPAVRLLRYLVTHPSAVTGRQLASAARVHHSVARQVLERLTQEGVLERRRAGTAYLYSLNRSRYVVTEILEPAFRNEARWLERLGEELLASLRPSVESVVLYGSWAREVATPRSDIDLLLVVTDEAAREAVEGHVVELRGLLGERFGRLVSLMVMTAEEVRAKLGAGDQLLRSIVSEGRVLAGRSLAEIAVSG